MRNEASKEPKFNRGDLVEVTFDKNFGDGASLKCHARLWVIGHHIVNGQRYYYLSDNKTNFYDLTYPDVHEDWMVKVEPDEDIINGYKYLHRDVLIKSTDDASYFKILDALNRNHGCHFSTTVLTNDVVALIAYVGNMQYNNGYRDALEVHRYKDALEVHRTTSNK